LGGPAGPPYQESYFGLGFEPLEFPPRTPFMETNKNKNGWQTFLENWWLLFAGISVLLGFQLLNFFGSLSSGSWICCIIASFALMLSGAGFIIHAKMPVYRSGRYFTFGFKSVPARMQRVYRWGWGIYLIGLALALFLLLSKSLF
jgi:hypothetical protein